MNGGCQAQYSQRRLIRPMGDSADDLDVPNCIARPSYLTDDGERELLAFYNIPTYVDCTIAHR
jgi:hypothetical protein